MRAPAKLNLTLAQVWLQCRNMFPKLLFLAYAQNNFHHLLALTLLKHGDKCESTESVRTLHLSSAQSTFDCGRRYLRFTALIIILGDSNSIRGFFKLWIQALESFGSVNASAYSYLRFSALLKSTCLSSRCFCLPSGLPLSYLPAFYLVWYLVRGNSRQKI